MSVKRNYTNKEIAKPKQIEQVAIKPTQVKSKKGRRPSKAKQEFIEKTQKTTEASSATENTVITMPSSSTSENTESLVEKTAQNDIIVKVLKGEIDDIIKVETEAIKEQGEKAIEEPAVPAGEYITQVSVKRERVSSNGCSCNHSTTGTAKDNIGKNVIAKIKKPVQVKNPIEIAKPRKMSFLERIWNSIKKLF